MGYSHKVVVGVDVVELEEEVDLYSVPELKKFTRELLKKDNHYCPKKKSEKSKLLNSTILM